MLKTRPLLKAEARVLTKANPTFGRQMALLRLLSFVVSTILAITLGNPVIEQINTVLGLMEVGGFTESQLIFILQSLFFTVGSRLSVVILVEFVWNMVATNLRFGILTSMRKVAAAEGSAQMSDLINGFPIFGRVVWMSVLISLLILGRSLLFLLVVTAVVAIMVMLGASGLAILFYVLALIAYIVFVLCISYRYILAEYILAENPSFTARQAIRESVTCSKGRIKTLLTFDLSFFGWALLFLAIEWGLGKIFGFALPAIATYIVTLILLPVYAWFHTYVCMSFTLFFRNIVGLNQQEAPPAPPPYSGGTGGSYSGPDIQI